MKSFFDNSIFTRVDSWLRSGPYARLDLGAYRIIYSLFLLLMLPRSEWVADYPNSMFTPPPGPFAIFSGFPPREFFVSLDVVIALLASLLLIGVFTVPVSWLLSLTLITSLGFQYSLGKIDHSILMVIVPFAMSTAGWGRALSIDSILQQPHRKAVSSVLQWPIRALAIAIGVAFATAAIPKLVSGWLDPSSQATQGHLYREYFLHNRQDLLAGFAVDFDSAIFWELLDWFTIILEIALIFVFLSWRYLWAILAFTTLFHLGVL